MEESYAEFNRSQNDEEDDDIGALESILSWDEDEAGPGGAAIGASLADRDSVHNSSMPDLVSFNLKDAGLTSSYLQRSNSSAVGTIDPSALNLPLPPRIDFQKQRNQTRLSPSEDDSNTKFHHRAPGDAAASAVAGTQAQQQEHLQQQRQQIQQQQQQIQQQQQQIQQQQHMQQQFQQQQIGAPSPASQQHTPQQVAQQQVVAAAAASIPAHLQGAFNLLQHNAILAQQAQNAMTMPQRQGQDPVTDQQQQPTALQFIDPNTFLRQLQVAQLQQHFNAVQQAAQVQSQQAMGAASGGAGHVQALQQQLQFSRQVPLVNASMSNAGSVATSVPVPVAARRPSSKKPSAAQCPNKPLAPVSARTPLVSASDTDGELSLKQLTQSKGGSKRVPADRMTQEIDMSDMTEEERSKANRDRNREHARNTRLRKKAYLEKLKETVDELCRERDTLVSERAGAANILVDMNNTRTEVLMSFLALRSANEKRRELWASILDESRFACVMPVTPYRSFPASEVQASKCQRTILGIDGMMADTASLHVLLNSLVDRSRFPNAAIVFRYTLVTEEAVVAGNQMMARWVMTTMNATQCGARMEVAKQGMLCCKFNSAHKIIGLEMMFDVMALMLQLKQAAGSDTFSVIPNTVQTCQRSFDKPMVMILAEEPYTIVQVNKLWEQMSGFKAEEVVGKTSIRILEGEQTDHNSVEVVMNEIRFKRPVSAMILHYHKSGERFRDFFLAYPLSTDSRVTHYLMFTTHVGPVVDAMRSERMSAPVQALNGPSSPVQNKFLTHNLQANFDAAKNAVGLPLPTPTYDNDHSSALAADALPDLSPDPILSPSSTLSAIVPTDSNLLKREHPCVCSNASDAENAKKIPKTENIAASSAEPIS